jgi:spore coat polysaccharide biosynthesis protein SpsF
MKPQGKIVATIEARMGSSRLPGKVLKEIAGVPMLELMIDRVKRAKYVDEIVLATTLNPNDAPLEKLAARMGIQSYRGSEDDVLDRVLKAAQSQKGDYILELWGDNPLIDPKIIDDAIFYYRQNDFDCIGTHLNNTYPLGMSMLVFSTAVLKEVDEIAIAPVYRENVSNYIYQHPQKYSTGHLPCPDLLCRPKVRLTVDEPKDFELVSRIFEALRPQDPGFSTRDILAFLDGHPELLEINKLVQQRKA